MALFIKMDLMRRFARWRYDRWAMAVLVCAALVLAGQAWLRDHPQHNPWAPLNLADPPGWATERKFAALRGDPGECRAVLDRSGVAFVQLDATGEGSCRRDDRVRLSEAPLSPSEADATCATMAGFVHWLRHGVQPAARDLLGSPVARVEHLGSFSCRRLYGRATGGWSQHATGNAIDISAFVLEDGRRVAVLGDWYGAGAGAKFLRRARDSACRDFATVLSPDYNAAHADHFHLDQQARMWGMCR